MVTHIITRPAPVATTAIPFVNRATDRSSRLMKKTLPQFSQENSYNS